MAKNARKAGIICHICGEAGHKSYQCPKNTELMDTSEPNRGGEEGQEQMSRHGGRDNEHPPQHLPPAPRGFYPGRPGEGPIRPGQYMTTQDQQSSQMGHQYQPYQFHPRPMFPRPHREPSEKRDENAPRRNIEDVVCYKASIIRYISWILGVHMLLQIFNETDSFLVWIQGTLCEQVQQGPPGIS